MLWGQPVCRTSVSMMPFVVCYYSVIMLHVICCQEALCCAGYCCSVQDSPDACYGAVVYHLVQAPAVRLVIKDKA